jgi:hypothetical protein
MRERSISEEDLLRVMNDPDLTYPSYGKQVAEELSTFSRVGGSCGWSRWILRSPRPVL